MTKRILLLFCVFISFNLLAQIPTDGLIGHYPLDGDGTDLTSNSNHGDLVDGVTTTLDRFGIANGALEFNGQDGYVNVPHHTSLNLSNEISISVWIKVANLSNASFIGLVNKWEDGVGGYYLGINNNAFQIRWNTGVGFTDGSPIAQDEWIHLVVTYGASSMIVYKNGVEDISVSGGGPISATSVDLRFGQQSQIFGNSLFFSGDMDEVLIYDRVLSSDEVAQIFENDPTNVENIWADSNIKVSPNPMHDFFQIKTETSPSNLLQGEIYDPSGKLMKHFVITSNNEIVSTNNLQNGFYVLIIKDENGIVKREKLLKI